MISFCIITIGDKVQKTKLCIESIHQNFCSKEDYEIILVGNNIDEFKNEDIKIVEDNKFKEFLGARKNIGFKNSLGDVIVHCDDDVIFPSDWYSNFKLYDEKNPDWKILGNRFLLPDGSRHWDRATFFPYHVMVPYDYQSDTDTFYQSGGFSVCKRSLLENITWSNEIPYYGMFKGFDYNEDVDFSIRLKEAGIKISFDENNTVWHYDYSYYSDGLTCNKKTENAINYKCLDFILLLKGLDYEK